MAGLSIQDAPQSSVVNLTDVVPTAQGDGLAKTHTIQRIYDAIKSWLGITIAAGNMLIGSSTPTAGAEKLQVTGNGYFSSDLHVMGLMGLGTTSPNANLDVVSPSSTVVSINLKAGAMGADLKNWRMIVRGDQGGDLRWGTVNDAYTSGNDYLFLTRNGHLLIGGSPAAEFTGGEALQVTGSVCSTGYIKSSGNGIGYAIGAGGAVTQATNKATGVTLNKLCGTITLNGAALANATTVSFTLTNSFITATDLVYIVHDSVGTLGAYTFAATPGAGSATISIRNVHTASLSEAIVLRFAIIKGVVS